MKRKQSDTNSETGDNSQSDVPGPSSSKHGKQDEDPENNPGSESDDDSDQELDMFFEEEPNAQSGEGFDELEEFFEPQDGVGDDVGEQIGKITDRALRGNKEKKDEEKLNNLKQKHLRPKNVPNLQVPKVDDILWRQLKREVRAVDFQLQRSNANYNQALIPVVKAMEYMKSSEHGKASECITDAFKILCLNIKTNIAGRRERIRKELQTKFRPLCQNEASATNLFGDNFQEAVKKLEATKSSLTTTQNHFLGKKGGSRNNQSYNNQSYNNSNNKYHQHQRHASHKFERKTQTGYKKKTYNQTRK